MDRWKSTGGNTQRREEEERRSEKRKSEKKEDVGARQGRKVAVHCVSPMICGSGGSKGRLAKAAGAEPAGQMRDAKLHAVAARSKFRSQNVQSTSVSDHFWKLWCRKSARRCGARHISKSKCTKHTILRPLLEVEMVKKCTPLWHEAHLEVKMYKTHQQRILHLAKHESFVAFPKTMAGVGHLKGIWKDAFRVTGAVQETCSSEMLGGQGADFLRWVAFWSLRSSGLLRWFWVTGAALRMTWHHLCVACAALYTDGVEKSQNALVRGRQLCTQLFHFLKEASQNCLVFWCCQLQKVKEVSQNCFVFDVVNFENWGNLAKLLPC